jgi:hypothetical protein
MSRSTHTPLPTPPHPPHPRHASSDNAQKWRPKNCGTGRSGLAKLQTQYSQPCLVQAQPEGPGGDAGKPARSLPSPQTVLCTSTHTRIHNCGQTMGPRQLVGSNDCRIWIKGWDKPFSCPNQAKCGCLHKGGYGGAQSEVPYPGCRLGN